MTDVMDQGSTIIPKTTWDEESRAGIILTCLARDNNALDWLPDLLEMAGLKPYRSMPATDRHA